MCLRISNSRLKMSDRNHPKESFPSFGSLTIILLLYIFLAILYAVLTPPWETPDEPAHYRYVTQLAERWRPPPNPMIRQRDRFCRDYIYTTSNYEWYHPALGYLPLAVMYKFLSLVAPSSLPATIPPFNPLFCSDPFTNPNLFHLETPHPLKVWQNQWGLLILRMLSSLWGLVVIFVTYRIGLMLGMESFSTVAASWVAFLPQFVFINASIRNDTSNNAFSALVFLLSANMVFRSRSRGRKSLILIMGLVLGIGILTKITLVYLAPVALIATLLSPSTSCKEKVWSIVNIIGVSLIIVALYYLGYQEARAAFLHTTTQLEIKPQALSWTYWKPFFPMLLDLFFARFGWANVLVPGQWISIIFGVWALGVTISTYHTFCLLKYQRKTPEAHMLSVLYIGLILAFAGVIRYNLSHFQPQGRFLFPALVSWALLGTWGIARSLPTQLKRPIELAMMGLMLLFNLRALVSLVSAYYF